MEEDVDGSERNSMRLPRRSYILIFYPWGGHAWVERKLLELSGEFEEEELHEQDYEQLELEEDE